jgi:hypothetical protein
LCCFQPPDWFVGGGVLAFFDLRCKTRVFAFTGRQISLAWELS